MGNISWGTKIAAVYIGFVILIITMVTMAMRQKIELVTDNYYEHELVYQNKIDEMNNANALSEKVSHLITTSALEITFPSEFKDKTVYGNILFYRPSDKSKDFTVPVQLNGQMNQVVLLSKFEKGMYKMQVSWKVDNKNYFSEEVIVIP